MIIGYSLAPSLWHSNQTCKSFDESDKFAKFVVILWLHMSSNFEMYCLSKAKCLMWKLCGNEVKMFVCILHVLYFPLNSFTWSLHTKGYGFTLTLEVISHWSNYFTSWTLTYFWLKLYTPTCKCITIFTSHVWMFIINPTHAQC